MLRKQIEKFRRQNGKERGAKIFLEKVSILGRYQGLRYWIHMYIHMSKRIWWEDIRQKNGFITLVSANFIPVSVGAPERGRIHKHYFCHNFQVQRRHTTQTRGIWVDTGENFYRDIRRETARHSFRACKIHSRTSFNLDLNIFSVYGFRKKRKLGWMIRANYDVFKY